MTFFITVPCFDSKALGFLSDRGIFNEKDEKRGSGTPEHRKILLSSSFSRFFKVLEK